MLKSFKLAMVIVSSLIIIACAATPKTESTGEYVDSSAVTAKVKTNLVDQLRTKAFAIKVVTYKGEVQLSGYVDSSTIKHRAGIIAANTIDVRRVRNDLVVK